MRRASDDTRAPDDTRGGVDLIHASLSSAEKLDMPRARSLRTLWPVFLTKVGIRPASWSLHH